jgi:hypothetical protein
VDIPSDANRITAQNAGVNPRTDDFITNPPENQFYPVDYTPNSPFVKNIKTPPAEHASPDSHDNTPA